MLTEDEKRQLAGIDSELYRTDPAFAARFADGWQQPRRWRRWASPLGTVVALTAGVLGIGLAHVGLVVPSVTAVVVAAIALGLTARYDRQPGSRTHRR